jgi:ribosomal protein L7/L12
VEKVPGIIKTSVKKEEAEKIKEVLQSVGCKVNLK